jgi:hypothetical protein
VRFTRWLSRPFTVPQASENQLKILIRFGLPIVD